MPPAYNSFNMPHAAGGNFDYGLGQHIAALYALQDAQRLSGNNLWDYAGMGLPTPGMGAGGASGGSGSGGGGSSGDPFTDAWASANRDNERRFNAGMGEYRARYERNMDRLRGTGDQDLADINQHYDNLDAASQSDMSRRGIANTTVQNTARTGIARERANSLTRSRNDTAERLARTDAGLSKDLVDFMERRDDNGPDLNLLASLAAQYGAAGGGGYGGGAGGANSPLVDMGGFLYAPLSSMGYNVPSAAQLSRPNPLPQARPVGGNRPRPNPQGGGGSFWDGMSAPSAGGGSGYDNGYAPGDWEYGQSMPYDSYATADYSQNRPAFEMGAGYDMRFDNGAMIPQTFNVPAAPGQGGGAGTTQAEISTGGASLLDTSPVTPYGTPVMRHGLMDDPSVPSNSRPARPAPSPPRSSSSSWPSWNDVEGAVNDYFPFINPSTYRPMITPTYGYRGR